MKKFVLILLVAGVVALAISSAVQAQEKWLPGMLSNGYVLCENGMGRSLLDPSAPLKQWGEVTGESSRSAKTVIVPADTPPKNPVQAELTVKNTVSNDQDQEGGFYDRFVRWQTEGKLNSQMGLPHPMGSEYKHCAMRSGGKCL